MCCFGTLEVFQERDVASEGREKEGLLRTLLDDN